MNLILELLKELGAHDLNYVFSNLDKDWSRAWAFISTHPKLSFEHVLKHPDFPWDWFQLSQHRNIKMDHIRAHPELPWNFYALTSNPNLTLDFVEEHLKKEWRWDEFSRLPFITFEFYLKHKHLKWETNYLIARIIPLDYFDKHFASQFGSHFHFCYSPHLTLEYLEENIHKRWDFSALSSYQKIPINLVKKYLNKEWNFRALVDNPSISLQEIEENLDLPWHWETLSASKKLTPEFLEKYFEIPKVTKKRLRGGVFDSNEDRWDWDALTKNPRIPWSFIEKHKDWPWNKKILLTHAPLSFILKNSQMFETKKMLKYISANPNLPPSRLEKGLKLLNVKYLYENPNTSEEFIKKHPEIEWPKKKDYFSMLDFRPKDKYCPKIHSKFMGHLIVRRKTFQNRRETRKLLQLKNRLPSDLLVKIGEEFLWN